VIIAGLIGLYIQALLVLAGSDATIS